MKYYWKTYSEKLMKYEHFVNKPPQTPYAATWDYAISLVDLPINVNKLAKTCLSKEKEILKLPFSVGPNGKFTDGYTGVGKNTTTTRFQHYNVLAWDTYETNLLKKLVKTNIGVYNKLAGNPTSQYMWARCWVNILRWGAKLQTHLHTTDSNGYLSAHFTVQATDTDTCYVNPINAINDPPVYREKNKGGKLTIFPSNVPHYTTRHYSLQPRITIAMDISLQNRAENWILL